MCHDCWREANTFACCRCRDDGDNEDKHKMLVVFESTAARFGAEIGPGVYRIANNPYWESNILNSWLVSEHLERLCDLPKDLIDPDPDYPCGHLCLECQTAIINGVEVPEGAV
jgi:hypothetical protein